jgi:hypothetical protein
VGHMDAPVQQVSNVLLRTRPFSPRVITSELAMWGCDGGVATCCSRRHPWPSLAKVGAALPPSPHCRQEGMLTVELAHAMVDSPSSSGGVQEAWINLKCHGTVFHRCTASGAYCLSGGTMGVADGVGDGQESGVNPAGALRCARACSAHQCCKLLDSGWSTGVG